MFDNSWHCVAAQYKKDGSGSICTQKHGLKREARIHPPLPHTRNEDCTWTLLIVPETKGLLLLFYSLLCCMLSLRGSQWSCSASSPYYTIRLRLVMVQRSSKGCPLPPPLPCSLGNIPIWPEIMLWYWGLGQIPFTVGLDDLRGLLLPK